MCFPILFPLPGFLKKRPILKLQCSKLADHGPKCHHWDFSLFALGNFSMETFRSDLPTAKKWDVGIYGNCGKNPLPAVGAATNAVRLNIPPPPASFQPRPATTWTATSNNPFSATAPTDGLQRHPRSSTASHARLTARVRTPSAATVFFCFFFTRGRGPILSVGDGWNCNSYALVYCVRHWVASSPS